MGQLFSAGILPGLLYALLFMTYVFVRAKLAPGRIAPVERKERWRDVFLGSINLLLIFLHNHEERQSDTRGLSRAHGAKVFRVGKNQN